MVVRLAGVALVAACVLPVVSVRSTAEELSRVASAVERILHGSATFQGVVQEVAQHSVAPFGYERPVSAFFQAAVERQPAPLVPGADGVLVAVRDFIQPHIDQALQLSHPLAQLAVDPRADLVAAVRWSVSLASDAQAISDARSAMSATVARWRSSLSEVDAQLRRLRTPEAAAVQQAGCSMATVAAIIRGLGLPDVGFTAHQCSGFPCVGDYPDTGMFRECERPASRVFSELSHSAHRERVESTLLKMSRDPARRAELEKLTEKTYAEVAKGVARGPYLTPADVDDALGSKDWHPLHRFAVCQGIEKDGSPKVRPCDNAGKRAQTNDCLSSHETIACEHPSFPVLVAKLFSECGGSHLPLTHSTDDVELAYRRMAAAHPEASVVMLWDTRAGAVTYWLMDGHNFGLAAAVLSFNRYSQLVACVMRRLYGCPCAAYFDDYDITDQVAAGKSGKDALHYIHGLFGISLSGGEKDVPPAPANPFLGVISDLSRVVEGVAVMRSKPSRVAGIILAIEDMLSAGAAPAAAFDRLVGKLEYTTSTGAAVRFGRAALAVLREFAGNSRGGGNAPFTPEVVLALRFFVFILPLVRPRVFRLWRRVRPPVIVYTDARYSPGEPEPAQLGIVVFDPEDTAHPHSPECPGPQWRHSSLVVGPDVMRLLAQREQYVGQLEVMAGVAAYTSLPEQLRGRDVIHFIDNTGALFGMAKGYSGDDDSARMIHAFHTVLAAIDCNVWLEYVQSGANISDLPSRGKFELLAEMGSIQFEMVIPPVGGDWWRVYTSLFMKLAPRPSAGAKRARTQVAAELESLKARRVI